MKVIVILIATCGFVATGTAFGAAAWWWAARPCTASVWSEQAAPDGQYVARVIARDCGPQSIVVELSTAEHEHVVFGVSDDIDAQYVRVTWLGVRSLRIAYPTHEDVVATPALRSGVTIRDDGWRDVSITYANWP